MENRLPKSLRKYVCCEKARIHRDIFDIKEQKKSIDELYKKVIKSPKIKEPVSEIENKSVKISKKETNLPKEIRPVKSREAGTAK